MSLARHSKCAFLNAGRVTAGIAVTLIAAQGALVAQTTPRDIARIALSTGLTLVQTLHVPESGSGPVDRESLVTVEEVSPTGVRYLWRFVEVRGRDTLRSSYRTFTRSEDLASAERWRESLGAGDSADFPGYTIWTVSSAIYRQLVERGSAPFAIMAYENPTPGGLGGILRPRGSPVLWRGTLTRVSDAPGPFPLLVDGQRVNVPALHLRGEFTATRARRWVVPDIRILADAAHPLFLRFGRGAHVWQTVRIETGTLPGVERRLTEECRVELPGIHFGFNSAELYPASDRALAALAAVLARHADWTGTIEGHTDSIGSAAANRLLSERRAEAVRSALIRHGIDGGRLLTTGFGATRPRESNASVEGRARNRRVELIRECADNRKRGG